MRTNTLIRLGCVVDVVRERQSRSNCNFSSSEIRGNRGWNLIGEPFSRWYVAISSASPMLHLPNLASTAGQSTVEKKARSPQPPSGENNNESSSANNKAASWCVVEAG